MNTSTMAHVLVALDHCLMMIITIGCGTKLVRDEARDGDGVELEWRYGRGAYRGRGVWSMSKAASLPSCMRPPDHQEGRPPRDDPQWCVCYQADLEARGRARLGMGLGLNLARMQAQGTDQLLDSLMAVAEGEASDVSSNK